MFMMRPVQLIPYESVTAVEIARLGDSRSFDIKVLARVGAREYAFSNVQKEEFQPFSAFLKTKGIRVISDSSAGDAFTTEAMMVDESDDADDDAAGPIDLGSADEESTDEEFNPEDEESEDNLEYDSSDDDSDESSSGSSAEEEVGEDGGSEEEEEE